MLFNDLEIDWACVSYDPLIILAQHKQTRKKSNNLFTTNKLDTLWYTALNLLSGGNLQFLHIWHNHQALEYSLQFCLVSVYNWLWYYIGMFKLLQTITYGIYQCVINNSDQLIISNGPGSLFDTILNYTMQMMYNQAEKYKLIFE